MTENIPHRDTVPSAESEGQIRVRPFQPGDEAGMAGLIAHTLQVSNSRDYSPEYLDEIARGYGPGFFAERAGDTHFYVVLHGGRVIGCGGVTGYRGSAAESYLLSIFVHPAYQGRGIGRRIMAALESDEYFTRASRAELAASITAVEFYRKLGYGFKDGVTEPDASGVVRMEKRTKKAGQA